jgi:hypothetical protein
MWLAAVALLSIGVGIGGNTAIFSAVAALLLRRLPVPEPGRLYALHPPEPHPRMVSDMETFRSSV